MATNTYVALATQTLSSAVSSVTFSSIPQGYTDLVIVINSKLASTTSTYMNFNGDTTGNYSLTRIYGNGASVVSDRIGTNLTGIDVSYTGSSDGNNVIINIMNYSNTTTNKTSLNRWNTAGSTGYVGASVSLWRSTAAITSIVFSNSVNFSVGSTFAVYGIAASDNSYTAKASGGTVTADVGYIYHTFSSSGSFIPTENLTCDVLVVGGGGAGEIGWYGGGGGGGKFTLNTGYSVTPGTYTVTVGAGGAPAAYGIPGGTGSTTTFGPYSAVGGAGGFSQKGGTSGDGYVGGNAYSTGSYFDATAGGGGGASHVGYNGASNVPGNGGEGQTFGGMQFAGGGGGGPGGNTVTGGLGKYGGGNGGGGGGNTTLATAGTAGTGGGGGGGGFTSPYTGGYGGSGAVVIRYPK